MGLIPVFSIWRFIFKKRLVQAELAYGPPR
jgi:hypothetical protein